MTKICTSVRCAALAGVFALVIALPARGAVSMIFSDNNVDSLGTTTTTNVVVGASAVNIPITLRIVSTTVTDNIVSANFLLQTDHVPAKGVISISSRNFGTTTTSQNGLSGSVFDPDQADSTLGMPGLPLNPKSNQTTTSQTVSPGGMGASTAPGTSLSNGTFTIATFLLTLAPNTSTGTYNITTTDSTWGNSGFNDSAFASQAVYQINVVPEPVALGVAGTAVLLLSTCRGRRRRVTA